MRIGGVVVCGGESRRMGRPKAWLPFGAETMLERVVRILGGVVSPIVVVAAVDQEIPPLDRSVRIARDERPGLGPLEGLRVGLRNLQNEVEAGFVTSCDVPGLRPDFIHDLIGRLGTADAVVPCDDRFVHCLAAVYRTSTAGEIDRLLSAGERRPRMLFENVPTERIPLEELRAADPELLSLQNVNTPGAYDEMLAKLLGDVAG